MTPISRAAPSPSRRRSPGSSSRSTSADNEFVHKGQPLIHIDRRQYEIDRESAEGALDAMRQQQQGAYLARRDRAQELSRSPATGRGSTRERQGHAGQGAGRSRAPAQPAQGGHDAAGSRRRDRRARAGRRPGAIGPGPGRAEFARPAAHRRSRYAGDPTEGSDRAGAGEVRPGQSQSRMDDGRQPRRTVG